MPPTFVCMVACNFKNLTCISVVLTITEHCFGECCSADIMVITTSCESYVLFSGAPSISSQLTCPKNEISHNILVVTYQACLVLTLPPVKAHICFLGSILISIWYIVNYPAHYLLLLLEHYFNILIFESLYFNHSCFRFWNSQSNFLDRLFQIVL